MQRKCCKNLVSLILLPQIYYHFCIARLKQQLKNISFLWLLIFIKAMFTSKDVISSIVNSIWNSLKESDIMHIELCKRKSIDNLMPNIKSQTLNDMSCLLMLKVSQISYFSWEFLVHYLPWNEGLRLLCRVCSDSVLHSFLHICSICNSSPASAPQRWQPKFSQYQRHSQLDCKFCQLFRRNLNQPCGTCIQSRRSEPWTRLKLSIYCFRWKWIL